jgi:hypothetical protein
MRRFLTILIVTLLLVLAGFCYWKYGFTYSKGSRTGLLQKFSYKGAIFKTYEGELILSSIQSSGNYTLASEKFLFSVKRKDVAEKLIEMEGEWVKLFYNEKNGVLPWRGDTRYIVDSFIVAKRH